MPSTMQHSMVSTSASSEDEPEMPTMTLISLDARPVMVRQPAMTPAMPQATATVMTPRPPASREAKMLLALKPPSAPKVAATTPWAGCSPAFLARR